MSLDRQNNLDIIIGYIENPQSDKSGQSKPSCEWINIIFQVIYTVLAIILIVMGNSNMKNCELHDQISLWAVVYGSVWIAFFIELLFIFVIDKLTERLFPSTVELYINITTLVGLIGTWIWGMVLIYPCNECPDGCYFHLYKLALSVVIIPWIVIIYIAIYMYV